MEPKSSKAVAPHLNIYQRMIQVQKKVLSVVKNENISTGADRSYKAVSHDDVAALLHLPLAEAGIVMLPSVSEFTTSEFETEKKNSYGVYKQKWYRTDIKITCKWINADEPADFFESSGGAFALDTSDKSFAKSYSLALKIILLKVHLLESRDQEEQRVFEDDEPAKPKTSPPKPKEGNAPKQDKQPTEGKPPEVDYDEQLPDFDKAPSSKPDPKNETASPVSKIDMKAIGEMVMPGGVFAGQKIKDAWNLKTREAIAYADKVKASVKKGEKTSQAQLMFIDYGISQDKISGGM